MKDKRKICVVITARPSYSRIKTALEAIQKSPNLELQLVLAGSALLDRYGSAVEFVKRDGFEITAKVFNLLEGESLSSSAKTTGIGIIELSSVFDRLKPDFVVTVADRFETMATAIAAAYMNIPLVHIQGGEITGNIDEKVRHSITKLADYHFVASATAMQRVLQMGENKDSVFNTGCPSIDLAARVKSKPDLDFNPYAKYGGVGSQPSLEQGYWVVMQHPVTTEFSESKNQIEETLYAIKDSNLPVMWFWPNVDVGADGTSKGIRVFRENFHMQNVHFFKNMDGEDFLKLLINSKGIIGNSSVGIRECSYLGIGAVNIGSRQKKRERGENVIDVNYSRQEIKKAMDDLLNKHAIKSSEIYGSGNAGMLIAQLLEKIEKRFDKTLEY